MIVVTKLDKVYNEITLENINKKDEKFDLFLKKVLLIARLKTGFIIENSKLSIEVVPLKEFYIITITISSKNKDNKNNENSSTSDRKIFKVKDSSIKSVKNYEIYKVINSENLIATIKLINNNMANNKNSDVLIYLWKNSYYILIFNDKISNIKLNEYGYFIGKDSGKSKFILEHGKLLCSTNTIDKIASIF